VREVVLKVLRAASWKARGVRGRRIERMGRAIVGLVCLPGGWEDLDRSVRSLYRCLIVDKRSQNTQIEYWKFEVMSVIETVSQSALQDPDAGFTCKGLGKSRDFAGRDVIK